MVSVEWHQEALRHVIVRVHLFFLEHAIECLSMPSSLSSVAPRPENSGHGTGDVVGLQGHGRSG